MTEAAQENFEWCMQHPEKFVRFNYVETTTLRWRSPSTGLCSCGATVYLHSEYMGACQCPKCGTWYSLSGQELLPPDQWGWDGTDW